VGPALLLATLLAGCGDPPPPRFTHPEARWQYAVSHILFRTSQGQFAPALSKAIETVERIEKGADFAELARALSEDETTAPNGGFLGFQTLPPHENRWGGVIQALTVGRVTGPIETELGFHVAYRHTFEEGQELEAKYFLPAYGFFVTYRTEDGGVGGPNTKEQARALAEEARGLLAEGKIELLAAVTRYGAGLPPNGFLGNVSQSPTTRVLYDTLKHVAPGALGPIVETPTGFGVVLRGRQFRAIVRHILIQHVGSDQRRMNVTRSPEEALELAGKIRSEVRADGSNWADLVTRYSDDVISIPLQGAMGSFSNGVLPEPLESAILAARPGALSPELAVTPAGIHVIWRVN
jgi:hypothetical protein